MQYVCAIYDRRVRRIGGGGVVVYVHELVPRTRVLVWQFTSREKTFWGVVRERNMVEPKSKQSIADHGSGGRNIFRGI